MLPAADIERARARGFDEIAAEVALKRAGEVWKGLCPFHNEKTPSFYVYPDRHWHCFGCGAHGDAIGYVMRQRGLAFQAAVAWLLDMPEAPARKVAAPQLPEPRETESGTADRVRAILAGCGPVVEGTAAHLYLWTRGLKPTPALLAHPALWCSEINDRLPALVAPIVAGNGATTALQRIWCVAKVEYNGSNPLADARAPLTTRKKTLGPMQDGAVRLAPVLNGILGLCEGCESGLAAMQEYRVPVWATCGAARLGSIGIPAEIRQVIVFGDRGSAGETAAEKAADTYREQGRTCSVILPSEPHQDFNDQLRGIRRSRGSP